MPDSASDDPLLLAEDLVEVAGEIVHEQTVRAYVPVPPSIETTVRAPMPTPSPAREETVRAWFPMPPPTQAPAAKARPAGTAAEAEAEPEAEAEELEPEEVEDEELEAEELEPEELNADGTPLDVHALVSGLDAPLGDVPMARPDQPTVPEMAAKPRKDPRARRDDPPAVAGEVAIVDDVPGIFDPAPEAPRGRRRNRTAPAEGPRRDDPPTVSGEVAIESTANDTPEVVPRTADVFVMPSATAPHAAVPSSMMTSSGSIPVLPNYGGHTGVHTGGHSEISGPQLRQSGEITGPHAVLAERARARDNLVLWILAGALVVLAIGGVMFVLAVMQ